MHFLEIFITIILLVWAFYFVARHLTSPFKKNCKDKCSGCDYANSCKQVEK